MNENHAGKGKDEAAVLVEKRRTARRPIGGSESEPADKPAARSLAVSGASRKREAHTG